MVCRSLAEDSPSLPAVRIKVCDITRVEGALAVVTAGADAIGLVFYARSPRTADIHRAQEIIRALPLFVTSAGLFVNVSHCELGGILDAVPLDLLQFHGSERAEDCEGHRRPYLKALRTKPGDDVVRYTVTYPGATGIFLDTYMEGMPSGTGAMFDWSLVPADLGKLLMLAGGLTPDNIGRAVEQVKPCAVGVSGGAEAGKRTKDTARVRAFVNAVRPQRHDEI